MKTSTVRWKISGIRIKLGGTSFIQITDEAGNGWAYVPYSDQTVEEHIESYRDANLIVDLHNKWLEEQ